MNVRDLCQQKVHYNVSTYDLMQLCYISVNEGRLEEVQNKVEYALSLLSKVIDSMPLTDEQKLDLLNQTGMFEIAYDEN